MSNVLHGFTSAATELPPKFDWDKTRGATTTRSYKGTPAQILALETAFKFAGWNTSVTEGAVWTLEASLAADDRNGSPQSDTPTDLWELSANKTEKDVLSSNITVVKNLSAEDKAFLRAIMDGKEDPQDWDLTSAESTPDWSGDSTQQARADQLFFAIVAGMKSRNINVPTLRHTMTASRDYEFQSALTGVGEIFSKAALGRAEQIPSWIFNNLPADPASNPFTRTDGIHVFTGWNKSYPQIQVAAFSKSQIITEWEYGEWATVEYETTHS